MSHSTVSLNHSHQLWRYLTEGCIENWVNSLKFICNIYQKTSYNPLTPQPVPKFCLYSWQVSDKTFLNYYPIIALLFYRYNYLAGTLLVIDNLF
jgi:cobaltochelatase CobN